MKNITLTEEQAKLILQTIDISIKSGGTQAAAILLPIVYTIEKQLQSAEISQNQE
jgi:hypothetical protein